MKRILSFTLAAMLLLMLAAVPMRASAQALDMDELKKILNEPNTAKAGGLPALLEATVGTRRAEATLKALKPQQQVQAPYNASSILNPTWGWTWQTGWNWGTGDFTSTTFSSMNDAINAVRSYRSQYGSYPSTVYFYYYGQSARGQYNSSTGLYDVYLYDTQIGAWRAVTSFTP